MKLLLAEDDPKLLRHLAAGLRGAGHVVDCTQDGSEARWAVENGSYEALVFDIMMPHVDGVTLVRGLRRRGAAPKAFHTAAHPNFATGPGRKRSWLREVFE